MNKVLIFGSQGNLGSQCERAFSEDPSHEMVALSHSDCDVTNGQEIREIVGAVRPDFIINTVAYNAVDACENDEEQYRKAAALNVEAVRSMGYAAMAYDTHLIHFSTDSVFAGKGDYEEGAERTPVNRYGVSKMLGEDGLTELADAGLKYSLFRLPRLFGPPGIGASSKPSFFEAIERASTRQPELKIVNDETANFLYTRDVAKLLAGYCKTRDGGGIYHIPNEGVFSWYDAAKMYFEKVGVTVDVVPVSGDEFKRPAARAKYTNLANTRLPKLRTFEEALDDYTQNGRIAA